MTLQSKATVFREILSRPNRGLVTVDEAAGQVVHAIDNLSEIDDLLQLASNEMRESLLRFVQQAPRTDAEWEAMPFLVLDAGPAECSAYRSRIRAAVEALRQQLE